jgi:predicted RNA-binding Zn-ribbon protein involved in translation (DUF1610 family)
MKKLKTLEAHNAAARQAYAQSAAAHKNGIACPDCGAELVDPSPNITLTSNPPMKATKCLACGYKGYRIA